MQNSDLQMYLMLRKYHQLEQYGKILYADAQNCFSKQPPRIPGLVLNKQMHPKETKCDYRRVELCGEYVNVIGKYFEFDSDEGTVCLEVSEEPNYGVSSKSTAENRAAASVTSENTDLLSLLYIDETYDLFEASGRSGPSFCIELQSVSQISDISSEYPQRYAARYNTRQKREIYCYPPKYAFQSLDAESAVSDTETTPSSGATPLLDEKAAQPHNITGNTTNQEWTDYDTEIAESIASIRKLEPGFLRYRIQPQQHYQPKINQTEYVDIDVSLTDEPYCFTLYNSINVQKELYTLAYSFGAVDTRDFLEIQRFRLANSKMSPPEAQIAYYNSSIFQ